MKHLTRTQRYLIFALLAVLISAGVYTALFLLIQHNKERIAVLTSTIVEAESKQQASHTLLSLLRETVEERAQLAGYFLNVKSLPDFLGQLDAMGTSSGVALEVLSVAEEPIPSPKAANPSKKKSTVPVKNRFTLSLSFEGSWLSVVHFLTLLEHMPYALSVEEADIEWVERSNDAGPRWKGLAQLIVEEP